MANEDESGTMRARGDAGDRPAAPDATTRRPDVGSGIGGGKPAKQPSPVRPRGGAVVEQSATKPAAAKRVSAPPRPTDLRADLRDFASGRPQGWSHTDWLHFLETLATRGHDVRERDLIGIALEKERLDLKLSSIRGVGPQRRQALVERFGTVWTLRNASVEQIVEVARVPQELGEQIKAEFVRTAP